MSKHTSGRWTLGKDVVTDVVSEAGNWIARCGESRLIPEREMEANARLITAAPDMLNALRSALPALMATENDQPRIAERRALVLGAIEKAEGKRP